MKTLFIYITFLFISFNHFAQSKNTLGYKIEGDSIVFTFDASDYSKYTNELTGQRLDFDDFNIKDVVVSGEFNLWSRDQWKMKKVDKNIYELRKSLSDFSDEFSWEFKYVINNKYWAEPDNKAKNISPAIDKYGTPLNTYNLNIYSAYINKNGNAHFKLKGHKDAKHIVLSGTFNGWSEDFFKMQKTEDGWELTLQLKPNTYEYKFIVDGDWIEDPNNPYKKENEFDGYNSVIDIKVPKTFNLNGYTNAKEVILSGSFNDWNENELEMRKTSNGWTITILISGGKHHYKFIVDDNWIVDPENSVKEYDGDGNINSVVMIR